jgi:hypothetical protein
MVTGLLEPTLTGCLSWGWLMVSLALSQLRLAKDSSATTAERQRNADSMPACVSKGPTLLIALEGYEHSCASPCLINESESCRLHSPTAQAFLGTILRFRAAPAKPMIIQRSAPAHAPKRTIRADRCRLLRRVLVGSALLLTACGKPALPLRRQPPQASRP